ncbi:MAG: DUF6607 family protein [Bdellovibrionota bacterium]
MKTIFALLSLPLLAQAAAPSQLELGRAAILRMQGCYLVDFNYTETESLKPGYERDKRVYDVNQNKSVKEWIYADDISPNRLRLQHVLFAVGLDGKVREGSFLKHTGEEWEFGASYQYQFDSAQHWSVKALDAGLWTRRITNLDDGLRYSCASTWSTDTAYPEWSCASYAPIPGREYRDMGRHDYQGLDRLNRVVVYTNNWLERESNTKIIQDAGGKTPLAKELGKIWYVRLPDSECGAARDFATPRHAFWETTRESWDAVLTGAAPFVERSVVTGRPGRYLELQDLEDKYVPLDLSNRGTRDMAIKEIRDLIDAYRE